jgi:hypothetical protein
MMELLTKPINVGAYQSIEIDGFVYDGGWKPPCFNLACGWCCVA